MRFSHCICFLFIFFFSIIFCFLAHSCGIASRDHEADIDLNNIKHVVTIPSFKEGAEIHYSDIFSQVRYIELKADSDEGIIGAITRMEITNDNDIVILDRRNAKIARYDSCGNFINLIGERGHGPNEYVSIENIAYDQFENKLLVLDPGRNKILFYSLEGKMEKSINVPVLCSAQVIDKDHLVLYKNYFLTDSNFNYIIVDREGNTCIKFEEITKPLNSTLPSTGSVFNRTEDGCLLCWSYFSSILYKVEGNKIVPFLEIVPNEDNWSIARPDAIEMAYKNRNKKYVCSIAYVNGKILIDGYDLPRDECFYIWSDLQGNILGGQTMINDIYGHLPYSYKLNTKGKDLYFGIFQNEYKELLDSWGNRTDIPQKDREFVTRMANSINPIIQVCTVKD